MLVVGLISGTSLDAVDAALVDIRAADDALEISLIDFAETAWPSELRDLLRGWSDPGAAVRLADLGQASNAVGELFAGAASDVSRQAGMDLEAIDLICSHGQTVHHAVGRDGRALASLQIGQPAIIAELTGRTVVADFRPRDIAGGGQGAPLVSFVDALLFAEAGRTVAALNLGGIANVTVVPAGAPHESVAFDTGPGNALIDAAARRLLGEPFDRAGAVAAAGKASPALLDELLAEPYFEQAPPKSTGRELFGDDLVERVLARASQLVLGQADVLATLTELTSRSVVRALGRWSPAWPAVVHVSGGGTRNGTLMRSLERALAEAVPVGGVPPIVRPLDDAGLPSAAKEAVAFAILGHEALHGRPNNLPSSTGARQAAVLGAIWPGQNYGRLIRRASRGDEQGQRIGRVVVRRPRHARLR